MENLKIRASQAFKLMTEPKLKADKEAGNLSETTKTYLDELWLQNNYGFKEPVYTVEIMKGLLCEQNSIALVQKVLRGSFRIKNTQHFENEFIKGTPDIILKKYIEDVKTSFTIKTFFNAELEKPYYWQAQCYMALTGKTRYRLIFCLTDTPREIIASEKLRFFYKFGSDPENADYLKLATQIEINHNYAHLPARKRLKIFQFNYNPHDIQKLYAQIQKARIYYNNIKLINKLIIK